MINDIKQAARALWRQPAFSAVAILTLALGIGANTALFSVADAVLLRPLPYPEPERLAWIDGAPFRFGKAGFDGMARQFHESPMFGQGGLFATGAINVGGESGAERIRAAAVTAGFFPALGVQPVAGRTFTEDEVRGRARVVVVGHDLARRRALEPGGTVPLNGRDFTVIGVMPPRVDLPAKSAIWIPMGSDSQITGSVVAPYTIARLAPGVTPAQAVAEIDRIEAERYGRPRDPRETAPVVVPLTEFLTGHVRPLFAGVAAAVLLVLLVACINTTNLLLARVSGREREISVRRALGASRFRLVRHLLVEAALLSLAAGVLALPIGMWTLDGITTLLPATLHTTGAIAIDARALAATAALCVIATLLFAVAPAWSLRQFGHQSLLQRSSSDGADPFWRRFRGALVAAEIAIALVLIAGAATIVNTVGRLMRTDIGVRGERVLTLETTLPIARYDTTERVAGFHERAESAIAALPGVEAVGSTSFLPGTLEIATGVAVSVEGLLEPTGNDRHAILTTVTPGYFRAIGIDLVAGRHFTDADRSGALPVAIVSAGVARLVGLEPRAIVGRRIQVDRFSRTPAWATVVGVVGDVTLRGPEGRASTQLYRPTAQAPTYGTTFFAVKAFARPEQLAPAVRQTLATIDSDLPLYNVRTFDEIRAGFVADRRFAMTVMSAFGLLATVLAAIGLYGVLTYLVQLRTREIGIRMALGASPWAVRAHVVRSGLLLGAIGLVLGATGAYGATQLLASRVPGIEPASPLLVAAAAGAMLLLTAIVTWLPARRATRVDPVLALRAE